jgi:hypothetical protein
MPPADFSRRPQPRESSPRGGRSTLMTSAPRSARYMAVVGPACEVVMSTTQTPLSGLLLGIDLPESPSRGERDTTHFSSRIYRLFVVGHLTLVYCLTLLYDGEITQPGGRTTSPGARG